MRNLFSWLPSLAVILSAFLSPRLNAAGIELSLVTAQLPKNVHVATLSGRTALTDSEAKKIAGPK